MNVLVPGGTGLIGNAFTKALVAAGDEVWVLSRNPEKARTPPGVKVFRWDGKTPQGWDHLVEQAQAIVNLSGENLAAGSWTEERKRLIITSRVESGRAITAAIKTASNRPEVLMQASAVGYYGPGDDQKLEEDAPIGQDFLGEICAQWEVSTQPVEALGVRRLVIRTGLVQSAAGGMLPRVLLPFQLFVGGPLGSGTQWWPWIHLRDEIDAMIFLLKNPAAQGAYNLTAPEPVRMSEFGKTLGKVLQRPYWLPVPAFGLKLLLGEMSKIILEGQRAVPVRLQELGYQFHFTQLEPALKDLLGKSAQNSAS
ncbi:MAG: TIGR01777 family oxidoreductase [Anaerolineaceae bacterium]|nr:TIGR01777 family oxidoreductase [Anaerolineaceae bacterium]